MLSFCYTLFFLVNGMYRLSEPVLKRKHCQFLKDATEAQLPCSQLIEGKLVPKNIQLGACKDGTTMHITLHRECLVAKHIHNNAVGWWATTTSFTKVKRLWKSLPIAAGNNFKTTIRIRHKSRHQSSRSGRQTSHPLS